MNDNFEQKEEFRENLTLGLVPALEKLSGVQDICLSDHSPCDNLAITSWEQRYSTVLPHEIRDFYLATDGFKLTWNFNHGGQNLPLGSMIINRIGDLRRVAGLRHRFDTEHPTLLDLEVINNRESKSGNASKSNSSSGSASNSSSYAKPQFGLRWKMFELDGCSGNGRVCLVFPLKPDPPPLDDSGVIKIDLSPATPQVWYLDRAYDWHFLAPNFTTYFRMMLVHLGLPQWQALFTPFGPTPWAKHIINLIAPHLLRQDSSGARMEIDESNGDDTRGEDFPTSSVDPSIFRTRRSTRKTEDTM